jgi:hypothetical protein
VEAVLHVERDVVADVEVEVAVVVRVEERGGDGRARVADAGLRRDVLEPAVAAIA